MKLSGNLLEEKAWLEFNNFQLWKSYFKGKPNNSVLKKIDYNNEVLGKINKIIFPRIKKDSRSDIQNILKKEKLELLDSIQIL